MANEIYDSTWWGNTRQTASSIGTSTEMIQGQFNLTKIGDEEVTNGDFATDSDWTKGSGWTISGGSANCDGSQTSNSNLYQVVFVVGKTYKTTIDVNYINGTLKIFTGTGSVSLTITSSGTYEVVRQSDSSTVLYIQATPSTTLSIDNVSVKEVRATTVEASKCLADAIHRIGLQDIQN